MVVLWIALLGLGLVMSGAAVGLTLRDRRRELSRRDLPEQPGRHREPDGS
ncbi:hypothetical protein BJY16_002860 [Actinoplanes octamycinicus]|uniref:Uncharacterized protein n=1 Tax=Actinoplanes octamycinicus TaxID=135948 RepID=A0A7W7GW73_9ACTN|nr:hypothetical protein [Actinoplanes octamycinicus]MBB4739401.1 hypothetical protein [Actinoplanes octamycinicus]GIE63505.1 hypothetical protein Aoc01nite_89070 [Actinoplanes octamycinicus]